MIMKMLVTGALGFIGSNLTERLVREGNEVVALDNLHTGSEDNAASFKGKARIVKMDAGDMPKLNEEFDVIFHLGVYSSSPMYRKDPQLVAKALSQWISILEYVRSNPSCRLVYASSSSMYNGNKPPFAEDMAIKVTDYYTEARYAMERMAELYHDFYGLNSVGLRFFSVYGPHESAKKQYANLITQFMWQMKRNERPVILGDGTQSRDFTYVDDVVEAIILASRYGKYGIFNVGTGKAASLNDVVSTLNRKLGTKITPAHKENSIKNYVAHTLADTKRAESMLGFRAKIGLDEGIGRLIKSYPD